MAKRGRKPKPTHLKVIAGTDRPHRRNESGPEFSDGEIETPDWLDGDALEEWNRVTPQLIERGILKPIHTSMLAVYCQMHGTFMEHLRRGVLLSTAYQREMRILAESFYLTPGAQAGGMSPAKGTNRFAKHGRRLNPT